MQIENGYYRYITNVSISMDIIYILEFQMLRGMLSQRDFWVAHEYGGVQMDASTDGLVAVHEHTL